jgi:pimeloyl-ACP methyl ester carboxylesterase
VRFHLAEAGEGEPVLLLHGFPRHWYAWRRMIPLLADGYRLICPDLRGFGWSEAPEQGYDTETRVADVLALLDALQLDRVRLLGHEFGARTGFIACLRHPDRFSHFLALSAVHPWPGPLRSLPHVWRYYYTPVLELERLGAWTLANRPGFTRWLLRRGFADPSRLDPETLEAIEEFVASSAEPARARAAAALHHQYAMHDLVPMVLGRYRGERLRVPTLLLSGSEDVTLAPAGLVGGERFADDLRVEIVAGHGHALPEECPELVADAARTLFRP